VAVYQLHLANGAGTRLFLVVNQRTIAALSSLRLFAEDAGLTAIRDTISE